MKNNTKSNPESGLQSRSEQLSTEGKGRIDFAKRRVNRFLETDKVLALLRTEDPRFYDLAEVVGKWIWIRFSEKQPPQVTRALSELGFHWNNARAIWQHPCGVGCKEPAPFDPRRKYGSYFAADNKPN